MTRLVIIDDNPHWLPEIERSLRPKVSQLETLDPTRGAESARHLAAVFGASDERVVIIDIYWERRAPDGAARGGEGRLNALDVLQPLLATVDPPTRSATVYLVSGYDMEEGDATDLINRWNQRLSAFVDVQHVLAKPLGADQILALLNAPDAESDAVSLIRMVDGWHEPARLIDGGGQPTHGNAAWSWKLTEPPFEAPSRADADGRTRMMEEFVGALVGAEEDADYKFITSAPLDMDGRRVQIAYRLPLPVFRHSSIDTTLRAIAIFAAAENFERLRFYERVRQPLASEADPDCPNPSHVRLRASLRVEAGLSIIDETPETTDVDLDGRFFVDRMPVLSEASAGPDEPERQIPSPNDDVPLRSTRSFFCTTLPNPSPLPCQDAMETRPSELQFETRHARRQIEDATDPENRSFLRAWNERVGLRDDDCWAEIPIYMRAKNGCYDTAGWLILQHGLPGAALAESPETEIRRLIDKRPVTLKNFCIGLSHQLRDERTRLGDRARDLVKKFYKRSELSNGHRSDEVREFFNRLATKTVEWLNADIAAIARAPTAGSTPTIEAFVRRNPEERTDIQALALNEAPEATETNYPALFAALHQEGTILLPNHRGDIGDERPTARMAKPIMLGKQLVGVISLVSRTPFLFDERRAALLDMIIDEGLPHLAARYNISDRITWENALVHEVREATNKAKKAIHFARQKMSEPDAALVELRRADVGVSDLELIIKSFTTILGAQLESAFETFDVVERLQTLIKVPDQQLVDSLGARTPPLMGGVELVVEAERTQIHGVSTCFDYVLRVMLSNAVEHGRFREGASQINVRVLDDPAAPDRLVIRIDNPGSISDAARGSMFTPFIGDPDTDSSGLNMGLAAAKHWCDRSGASISVECLPGGDTVRAQSKWPRQYTGEEEQ